MFLIKVRLTGDFVCLQMLPLADHLTCPVCMGRLQHTHMTTCGHRYCESCIRECIDRLRRCPCCNAPLRHDQLIKDAQFDTLIGKARFPLPELTARVNGPS